MTIRAGCTRKHSSLPTLDTITTYMEFVSTNASLKHVQMFTVIQHYISLGRRSAQAHKAKCYRHSGPPRPRSPSVIWPLGFISPLRCAVCQSWTHCDVRWRSMLRGTRIHGGREGMRSCFRADSTESPNLGSTRWRSSVFIPCT